MKIFLFTSLVIFVTILAISATSLLSQFDQAIKIILGDPEVVMDYSSDSCRNSNGLDLPDVQAHAIRSPIDESVILISGNAPINYTMTGPDFEHLERNCTPALISGDSPLAYTFDNQEWLLSLYRQGPVIHALIHNEYHDPQPALCKPGDTTPANPCWYNGITYAQSLDGGHTFLQPQAPNHVVAALPTPWMQPVGDRRSAHINPQGYFTPSNIVDGRDGFFYSLFFALPDPKDQSVRGTCLMRTDDLADPQSWRAWDGSQFSITMHSPYDNLGNPAPTGLSPCAFVSPGEIGDLSGSLTYNTYFEKFILVGSGVFGVSGQLTCGTFFSLSENLIDWSDVQLLMAGKLPYGPCTTGSPNGSIIYPSLIDHSDRSINFEKTGQTPYLYYVLWNEGLDRDLVRIPIRFETE